MRPPAKALERLAIDLRAGPVQHVERRPLLGRFQDDVAAVGERDPRTAVRAEVVLPVLEILVGPRGVDRGPADVGHPELRPATAALGVALGLLGRYWQPEHGVGGDGLPRRALRAP